MNGKWPDPARIGSVYPQNLIDNIFNDKIPVSSILGNPQSATILGDAALPSKSWFYGYLHWYEANPDKGRL